jgi:glycosyltransferase involved in cell wall biosynthesis
MSWYTPYLSVYDKAYDEVPASVWQEIREGIAARQSSNPLVTVSVIAYNEERHLAACLWALSHLQCNYPMEIIGVDNDSSDQTAHIFRTAGIPYYTETRHSCGWARSCGLAHARGKYHINIDADTLYPPRYVETMVDVLQTDGVIAASSLWSYIPDAHHPHWQLIVYEATRDFYLLLQSFKRPELSVRGLVFAYRTEPARKVGIRTDIIRGEDGSLALGLKEQGKIVFVRNRKARAVTGYGTVAADGSLWRSFTHRLLQGLKHIKRFFTSQREYKDEESNLVK